jgi:hypothetical protein
MSDHWVTDNVEALLDMVLACTSSKVSEGTPQMLITSLDFSALQVVSLSVVLKEVFERRYANIVKETVQNEI